MYKFSAILLVSCLLTTMPASAGTLSFDGGKAVWQSGLCTKPTPPDSVLNAHPETSGNHMNSLIAQHNAYVDASQNYMNCIKNESANDQEQVNQAIASGAQKAIADMQSDVTAASAVLHKPQPK